MSSNAIEFSDSATDSSESATRQASEQVPSGELTDHLKAPVEALQSDRLKKQLPAIRQLATLGADGEQALVDFVRSRMSPQNEAAPTAAHGSAYQYLYTATSEAAKAFIEEFPEGLVCPQSAQGIDYSELQMLLVKREYEAADKLTNQKLCELAGESAIARKWVYFTEVERFPALDLIAMDIIWGLYSEDKFGWSKQHELWTRLGSNWERLWPQLQWKTDGNWTRYPNEFVWDLSAPVGHLPLSNQLRGVRTMSSLLSHPAWG